MDDVIYPGHDSRMIILKKENVIGVEFESNYSITCIKRPLKGSNESGLLQQIVFKCRFY